MNIKKFFAVLSIFTLTIFNSGCGSGSDENQNTAEILRVGTTLDFAPFEFRNPDEKEFQGFDMDIIRAIGRELGKPVEIGDINFEGLVPSLKSGNVDVFIAAITITDERKNLISFSDPYYESGLTIMILANESRIKSFEDLAGKKVGVIVSSTGLDIAKNIPDAQILEYENTNDSYPALKNRKIDALIYDQPVNDYAVATNQVTGVKILPDVLTQENYGIAVRKDNAELLQQINDALKKLHDSGEYEKIYSKWFGTLENNQ